MEAIPLSSDFVVRSSFHDYSVEFVDDLVGSVEDGLGPDDVIIIDGAVAAAHGDRLAPLLSDRTVLEVEASERAKSFDRVGGTIEALVESGFRRGNRIVVIGGGVLQDISAFIATVIYRGVDWHFVPTTLLAQGDSCIGGKSSINYRGYKNLLGSFLPPRSILIDVEFLSTLPPDEVTSGIGEILHFLVYSGEDDFAFLERHIDELLRDHRLSKVEADLAFWAEAMEETFPGAVDNLRDELLATSTESVVLHGDLHHDNILQSGDGWKAIDPHGLTGEPCYEVGALLRNPIANLERLPAVFERRIDILTAELGFSTERIRQWSFVQAVLSAWWFYEDGSPHEAKRMEKFAWAMLKKR